MKNGKKPTYEQRKLIHAWHLDPHEWFVVKDTSDQMMLVSRYSDKTIKIIPKG